MKNRRIISAWDKVNPDKKTSDRMLKNILTRAAAPETAGFSLGTKFSLQLLGAALACVTLAVLIFPAIFNLGPNKQTADKILDVNLFLSDSKIKVFTVEEALPQPVSSDLVPLSEEEIFNDYPTAIFKGTILGAKNIGIDFSGEIDYRAIITIAVDEVFRGDIQNGEIITILLSTPLNMEAQYWSEDTAIERLMKPGVQGIFMPLKYAKEEKISKNGVNLHFIDLADYHFPDGERFAFIEAGGKLCFARFAYPGLATAANLTEVEKYVRLMINK